MKIVNKTFHMKNIISQNVQNHKKALCARCLASMTCFLFSKTELGCSVAVRPQFPIDSPLQDTQVKTDFSSDLKSYKGWLPLLLVLNYKKHF